MHKTTKFLSGVLLATCAVVPAALTAFSGSAAYASSSATTTSARRPRPTTTVPNTTTTAAPTTTVDPNIIHTFSCAIAWDPTIPRATGEINGAGVPSNLAVHGGYGWDYRVIYLFNGAGTSSASPAKYKATPAVWDFNLTRAAMPTPQFLADAFEVAKNAGQVPTWQANILVWPTSLPAAPNAICTTLT
jgi:hypothetical protein